MNEQENKKLTKDIIMKVRLLDYKNREYWVDIPENTEYLEGQIISGDTVLTYPVFFDTGKTEQCTRTMNFFDGEFKISIKNLEKFNSVKDSYELFGIYNEV